MKTPITLKHTAELEDDIARIIALQKARREAWYELIAVHGEMLKSLENIECTLNFYTNTVHLNLLGGKEELVALIRILRTNGFTTIAEPPKEHSTSWCAMYEKGSYRIMANFSSRVCTMIKIGEREEVKKIPIYAIKCGDRVVETGIEKPEDDIPF